jgi:cytoskeletal protein RodZ
MHADALAARLPYRRPGTEKQNDRRQFMNNHEQLKSCFWEIVNVAIAIFVADLLLDLWRRWRGSVKSSMKEA